MSVEGRRVPVWAAQVDVARSPTFLMQITKFYEDSENTTSQQITIPPPPPSIITVVKMSLAIYMSIFSIISLCNNPRELFEQFSAARCYI